MSEYQYYEFRTVDRSLTAAEIAELRKLSTRAEITAASFTNTYSFGNFRGDPDRMIEQYFDAFVYVANWGTRHFMVRLPLRGVELPTIETYAGGGLAFWIKDGFVILSFHSESESGGEWEDGSEWMPGLISLREELLHGDFRSLYLGWLSGIEGEADDDQPEPPVPAGLGTLTAAEEELVAFLRLDRELLEVAAERSADRAESEPSQAQLVAWLRSQRREEKDAWLLELLGQSAQAARSDILRQFRQWLRGEPGADSGPPRTCQELREAAEVRAQEAERRRAEQAAAERTQEAKLAAKRRTAELNRLAQRIDAAWDEVERTVARKQPSQYLLAVTQLTDLRDLATRDGTSTQFQTRLENFVRRHGRKYAFVERLRKAGLAP